MPVRGGWLARWPRCRDGVGVEWGRARRGGGREVVHALSIRFTGGRVGFRCMDSERRGFCAEDRWLKTFLTRCAWMVAGPTGPWLQSAKSVLSVRNIQGREMDGTDATQVSVSAYDRCWMVRATTGDQFVWEDESVRNVQRYHERLGSTTTVLFYILLFWTSTFPIHKFDYDFF